MYQQNEIITLKLYIMGTKLIEDYIKHLAEQRVCFYNEGRFDIVEKINKQIKEAQWLQQKTNI